MSITKRDMIGALVADEMEDVHLVDTLDILYTLWCDRLDDKPFDEIEEAYKRMTQINKLH